MELLPFQRECLEGSSKSELVIGRDGLIKYVNECLTAKITKNIFFQAPTGSGKTIILSELIRCLDPRFAVVWVSIADADLHLQSMRKVEKTLLARGGGKRVVEYASAAGVRRFEPGDVVFISMQALKDSNSLIHREGDARLSIETVLSRTHDAATPILLVIDESHRGTNTVSWASVTAHISPKVVLDVSATNLNLASKNPEDASLVIPPEVVAESGLLKREIFVNQLLDEPVPGGLTVTVPSNSSQHELLSLAIRQQRALSARLAHHGSLRDHVPLILIQVGNNKPNAAAAAEQKSVAAVVASLKQVDGSILPGEIAVWTASTKENLTNIVSGKQRFLIFKQAVVAGWDCPRAHILVKLRNISESDTFDIQLLGRILRTLEHRHTGDRIIDSAYIFTDASNLTPVSFEFKNTRLSSLTATRRQDLLSTSLTLKAKHLDSGQPELAAEKVEILVEHVQSSEVGKDFRALLLASEGSALSKLVSGSSATANVLDLKGLADSLDVQSTDEEAVQRGRKRLREMAGSSMPAWAFDALMAAVLEVYKEHAKLKSLTTGDLAKFAQKLLGSGPTLEKELRGLLLLSGIDLSTAGERAFDFTLPLTELFDPSVWEQHPASRNLFSSRFLRKSASSVERAFEVLVDGSAGVNWWYRNGETSGRHYSLTYAGKDGRKHTFFPDYILQTKSGRHLVLDTKSGHTLREAVADGKLGSLFQEGGRQNFLGRIAVQDPKSGHFLINTSANVDYHKTASGDWSDFQRIDTLLK